MMERPSSVVANIHLTLPLKYTKGYLIGKLDPSIFLGEIGIIACTMPLLIHDVLY